MGEKRNATVMAISHVVALRIGGCGVFIAFSERFGKQFFVSVLGASIFLRGGN